MNAHIIADLPVRMGNLTFTWQAPHSDAGSLHFEASVAFNNAYVKISSRSVTYSALPVRTTTTITITTITTLTQARQ